MKFRTTLVLLALVLLVGGYVWFVDRFKPSTEDRKLVEKRVLKDFEPDKILAMHVTVAERTNEDGAVVATKEFELHRELEGWTLTVPFKFPADETKIRQVLDLAKKIDRGRVTTPEEYKKINRGELGLTNPSVVASFLTPSTTVTVRIGLEVPAQWSHYVEIDGIPEIYFVPVHFKNGLAFAMDSGEQDVRRHKIFSLRPYQVSSLVLEGKAASTELRRNENEIWRMMQPVADAADGAKIAEALKVLEDVQVAAFDAPTTNFGQPWLTISVVEGTRSQRLQLGAEASGPMDAENEKGVRPKNCWIARRLEYDQYFYVTKKDMALCTAGADTFRSKLLFDTTGLGDATHLKQEADGTVFELDRGQRTWGVPGVDSPLVNLVRIENYVYDWIEMAVTNFADAAVATAALAKPWIRVTVTFRDAPQPRTVVLSAPVDGLVYAERTPGVFVALDGQALRAHLATNELKLLERDVIMTPIEDVKEIAMRAVIDYRLVQSSNRWTCLVANGVNDVEQDMAVLLKDVLPLKVGGYVVRAAEKDLAAYGLAAPSRTITIRDKDGSVATVLVGGAAADGNWYGMVKGQPYVFVLPGGSVAAMKALDAIAEKKP